MDKDKNEVKEEKKTLLIKPIAKPTEKLKKRIKNKRQIWKHRITLLLGTAIVASVFIFSFLIFFVLEPTIATLAHRFRPTPGTCKPTSVQYRLGKSNCSWTSCTLGCTETIYECYQVRVMYSHMKWVNGTRAQDVDDWVPFDYFDYDEESYVNDTRFFLNIQACGYPPEVNCTSFLEKYETIMQQEETFPCFYSQVEPKTVIQSYNYYENVQKLCLAVAVPVGSVIVAMLILMSWYCPAFRRKIGLVRADD